MTQLVLRLGVLTPGFTPLLTVTDPTRSQNVAKKRSYGQTHDTISHHVVAGCHPVHMVASVVSGA